MISKLGTRYNGLIAALPFRRVGVLLRHEIGQHGFQKPLLVQAIANQRTNLLEFLGRRTAH